jgi:hypothetical protein
VIIAKAITSATAAMAGASGKCAGRKPGTPEPKAIARTIVALRDIDDLIEMLAAASIQGTVADQLLVRELPVDV